ncbi:peptide chain release factor 2 [Pseudomonadota bacterium]
MKHETEQTIHKLEELVDVLGGVFDTDNLNQDLKLLEARSRDPNLWENREEMDKIMKQKSDIENDLAKYHEIKNGLNENTALLKMAEEECDEENITEAKRELERLLKLAEKYKIEHFFSGEADKNDCFMEIHAGVGGTDSCDFVEMLLRMYLRWADSHNFKTEIVHQDDGEEAGIKSVTVKVGGTNAYGWTRTESGVHRLVRHSPFNANDKRHTSFASVWVCPIIDDKINIQIDEKDLKIDTYRASGAGGQHVNKTDSAVRVTHLPTGIVAKSQNSRSQHQNREEAMRILKSRLYELELQKRREAEAKFTSQRTDNSWGNQIRSYVLHPYQMVKDLRTGYETSNVNAVFDGDIDEFVMESLSKSE